MPASVEAKPPVTEPGKAAYSEGLPLLLRTLDRLAKEDNDPKLAVRVQQARQQMEG